MLAQLQQGLGSSPWAGARPRVGACRPLRAAFTSSRCHATQQQQQVPPHRETERGATPAPDQPSHRLDRRALLLLSALGPAGLALAQPVLADEVKLVEVRDNDIGYSLTLPEGWVKEAPGGKYNFYPPHDYAGKRVMIEATALGKKLDLDLAPVLGSPEQYGQAAVLGMETELRSTSQAEGGRYYYYEYTLPSFNPTRVWGVAGVGLGPNPTARQYNRKQLVKVTCMVPEEDLERDEALMRSIVSSFHFLE